MKRKTKWGWNSRHKSDDDDDDGGVVVSMEIHFLNIFKWNEKNGSQVKVVENDTTWQQQKIKGEMLSSSQ